MPEDSHRDDLQCLQNLLHHATGLIENGKISPDPGRLAATGPINAENIESLIVKQLNRPDVSSNVVPEAMEDQNGAPCRRNRRILDGMDRAIHPFQLKPAFDSLRLTHEANLNDCPEYSSCELNSLRLNSRPSVFEGNARLAQG